MASAMLCIGSAKPNRHKVTRDKMIEARISSGKAWVFLLFFPLIAFADKPIMHYIPGPFTAALGDDVIVEVPKGSFFCDRVDMMAWARYQKASDPEKYVGLIAHGTGGPPDYMISFRWYGDGYANEKLIEEDLRDLK